MKRFLPLSLLTLAVMASALFGASNTASAANGEFYLQVSPSPIVETLQPGKATTIELKVRNAGTEPERLKIQPRDFSMRDGKTVEFNDTKPSEIASWITFGSESFDVQPGQTFTQKITFSVPAEAGFSYSTAFLITRQDETKQGNQALNAQLAVFALLNIDRPGATRKLEIESVTPSKSWYEYVPADIIIRIKNTGNTIVQPAGDVFIEGGLIGPVSDVLAANATGGYILPGSSRELTASWQNGFPLTRTSSDGSNSSYTDWNWSNIGNFRLGQYSANVVATYDDGARDVPLTATTSFWIVPWKILLGLLIIIALVGGGLFVVIRGIYRAARKSAGNVSFIKKQ